MKYYFDEPTFGFEGWTTAQATSWLRAQIKEEKANLNELKEKIAYYNTHLNFANKHNLPTLISGWENLISETEKDIKKSKARIHRLGKRLYGEP